MGRKILILDTSVLCCWLRVPGKETSGPLDDLWDHDRIDNLLRDHAARGAIFVLPMATLLETGNHVSQAPRTRYELATLLMQKLSDAMEGNNPWAAFIDQAELWESEKLQALVANWPDRALQGMSIGDEMIVHVAEHYAAAGYEVEILTGDCGLKAYEPRIPVAVPRRRQ